MITRLLLITLLISCETDVNDLPQEKECISSAQYLRRCEIINQGRDIEDYDKCDAAYYKQEKCYRMVIKK